jgi:Ca2+-binding EF-hand superfamily protein
MFTKSRLSLAGLVLGLAFAALPAAAAESPMAGRAFDRLDTNQDGRVDSLEIESAQADHFKRLDADGDGVISATEQGRAENRIRRRAAMREARLARQFERLDANGDGAVSADEFAESQPVARADGNKDGVVSREEFEAAVSARVRTPRRN